MSNHKSNAIWQYRVKQLEEKQDKHNNVIERTYQLEKDVGEQKRDVKTFYNQMSEMKDSISRVEQSVDKLREDLSAIREAKARIEAEVEAKNKGV